MHSIAAQLESTKPKLKNSFLCLMIVLIYQILYHSTYDLDQNIKLLNSETGKGKIWKVEKYTETDYLPSLTPWQKCTA